MLEKIEETKPAEEEKKSDTLSQLLGVVYSGASNALNKHLLVTDPQTNLKLLQLASPEESVEEFLARGQKAGTITIPPKSAATAQRWQMLSTTENLLPTIDLKDFSTIYYAHISTTDDISRIDAVKGPDAFEIVVLENGIPETYIFADEAFYDGLANCQIVTAKQDTILLIPIKGDPKVGTAWIMTVALDNESNNTIGHSGAAGESLLSRLIAVIFRDIEPLQGGERRPQLARLVEFYDIHFEAFIAAIVNQVKDELTALAKTKKLLAYVQATSRLNRTIAKLNSRLKSKVTNTEQLLNLCAEGLLPDAQEINETDELQIAYNKIVEEKTGTVKLASMLKEQIEKAAFDTTKYYTPAQILSAFRNLGAHLINQDNQVDQKEEPRENTTISEKLVETMKPDAKTPTPDLPTKPKPASALSQFSDGFWEVLGVRRETTLATPLPHSQEPALEHAQPVNPPHKELQSSFWNEVGGNTTVTGTNRVDLENNHKWPSDNTYDAKYAGPSTVFHLKSFINSIQQELRVLSDPEVVLLQNGRKCIKSDRETNITLLPGDVFSLVDTKTNTRSEFVLAYNNKIELLSTNQLEKPYTSLDAAALMVETTSTEKQVIGYIITNEVNKHLAHSVYEELGNKPKEISWDGVGTLTYRCSIGSYRKLTLESKRLTSDSYVYALLEFDQPSLPANPSDYRRRGEFQEIELAIGSHLVAHDSNLGITHHLKVLPSGLIVTYTERKSPLSVSTTTQLESDQETTVVKYFDKSPSGVVGVWLHPNSYYWKPGALKMAESAVFDLHTFEGDPIQFTHADPKKLSQNFYTLTRFGDRADPGRSIYFSTTTDSPSRNTEAEYIKNGNTWNREDLFTIEPGDVFTVRNFRSQISATFLYNFSAAKIELIQTEDLTSHELFKVEELRDVPSQCSFLGYIGKVSRYPIPLGSSRISRKKVDWSETGTSFELEIDDLGQFVRIHFDFNHNGFVYSSQGKGGSRYILTTNVNTSFQHGDQIIATNHDTNERYVLRILPSGLIVSYKEDKPNKNDSTQSDEHEPLREVAQVEKYAEVSQFPKSGSAVLGAYLSQEYYAREIGSRYPQLQQYLLSNYQSWPIVSWVSDRYDGPTVGITLSTQVSELLRDGGSISSDQKQMYLSIDPQNAVSETKTALLINGQRHARTTDDNPFQVRLQPGDIVTLANIDDSKRTCFVFTYKGTFELLSTDQVVGNKLLEVENEFAWVHKPYQVVGYVGYPLPQPTLSHDQTKYEKRLLWSSVGVLAAQVFHTGQLLKFQIESTAGLVREVNKVISNYPYVTQPIRPGEQLKHGDHLVTYNPVTEYTDHLEILPSGLVVTYQTSSHL